MIGEPETTTDVEFDVEHLFSTHCARCSRQIEEDEIYCRDCWREMRDEVREAFFAFIAMMAFSACPMVGQQRHGPRVGRTPNYPTGEV